jgi:hypothetical protein
MQSSSTSLNAAIMGAAPSAAAQLDQPDVSQQQLNFAEAIRAYANSAEQQIQEMPQSAEQQLLV